MQHLLQRATPQLITVASSLKEYFHYGCAALRVASDSESFSDLSRFIALNYYRSDIETQISSLFNENHFATSLHIVHYRSLSLATRSAAQP